MTAPLFLFRKWMVCLSFALLLVPPGLSQASPAKRLDTAAQGTLLDGARRVVFLGDSITYSGQYVDDVEAAFRASSNENECEFLNLGLPSETVSGLSEPGHAGGSFPRPDLRERLDRILGKTRPDVVIACYGINDGIYYPFAEDRFQKFQEGILHLRECAAKAGVRIIHVTPPTFDALPIKGGTLPAGLREYRQPYEGYNEVMDRYSAWLVSQRTNGWTVVDAHTAMNNFLAERRRDSPDFTLARDGVHVNDLGHWLIAQELLRGLNIPAGRTEGVVDFVTGMSAPPTHIQDIQKQNGELRLTWQMTPMPLEGFAMASHPLPQPRLGVHRLLMVTNAEAPRYKIFEGDAFLTSVTRGQLAVGIDLRRFSRPDTLRPGLEILRLIHEKNRLLTDAWLTEMGHKRPGMEHGLPLAEAQARAAELTARMSGMMRH